MSRVYSKKLTSGYRNKIVVDDISINIPDNKISVIVGSNGCGKSTLLKNFSRILSKFSGEIVLDNKEYKDIKTKDLAKIIGLLPQYNVAPSGIKVFDLVSRGRFPYQKFLSGLNKEGFKIIADALNMVNISDLADKSVDELSGGQKQRVWIAMILAQQTDILFLDEPTTYLDISYQIEILDLLKELNKKYNKTIVMVLHDINLACKYADYMFALKNGKLVSSGIPSEIVNEKFIKEIFDLDCLIIDDPISKTPIIIPKSKHHSD